MHSMYTYCFTYLKKKKGKKPIALQLANVLNKRLSNPRFWSSIASWEYIIICQFEEECREKCKVYKSRINNILVIYLFCCN